MSGCLVAIAIEDVVDVWLRDGAIEYRFSADIPEGDDYLAAVQSVLSKAFDALLDAMGAGQAKPGARDVMNAIEAIAISVPGVIEANRWLLQIPRWHSKTHPTARWQFQGQTKEFFDFAEVLSDIADKLIQKSRDVWGDRERERFIDRVFVVNDASAAAAFEFTKRRELLSGFSGLKQEECATDFIYVKIHNGLNVGVVESGSKGNVRLKVMSAEAGHAYPRLHPLDIQTKFSGICGFHQSCVEGLVAGNSFYQRAKLGTGVFSSWNNRLATLERSLAPSAELDNRLMRYLLGDKGSPPAGDGEAVDILAHYVAQVIYQLAISPLAPMQFVVAGQMANVHVLSALRTKIVAWARGYPMRDFFTTDGVDSFIMPTTAEPAELNEIEVRGAQAIAFSQANRPFTGVRAAVRRATVREALLVDEVPLPASVTSLDDFKARKFRDDK